MAKLIWNGALCMTQQLTTKCLYDGPTTAYVSIDDEDTICSLIKKARVKAHSPGMLSQFQMNGKEAT
jgi:hypothetical protein